MKHAPPAPRYPSLEGRIAFVTGAARGIGLSTAEELARQHATVVMADLDALQLGDAARALEAEGHVVHTAPLDVRDHASVEQVVERTEALVGAIDFLVNAAGILRPAPLLELDQQSWTDTFSVNVHGVFYVCQAVARRMARRGRGAIVTVASNAAHTPRVGMGAYPSSKAAVVQLMRCLGLELARHGVRCNTVSPGSTDTSMQRALWQDDGAERRVVQGSLDSFRVGIPLGRIAAPNDIVSSILFLLSDQARHVTLQDLRVDGGATF